MISTPERQARRSRSWRRLAALAAAMAVGFTGLVAAQPAAAVGTDSWVSIPEPGYYRFTVPASAVTAAVGATPAHFAVEGNWGPGGTPGQLGLSSGGGNWTGVIGPLEPGLYSYEYKATIGGTEQIVTFRNPNSEQEVTSRPSFNTFFVEGADAAWLADVPAGGQTETLTYDSSVAGGERSALVWTPPSYDPNRADPYPVLTLLAGDGQSYREWAELGRVQQILDNLAVEQQLEPMVVVMADGDSSDVRTELLDNVLPAAREAFNISDDPADNAIAGIGRGASQALNLLLTATGEFSKVGAFSGSLVANISGAKATQINDATDLIRVYVGNETDPAFNGTADLLGKLSAAGVEYQFDGVNPEAGGTWNTWQQSLRDFASRLFREVEDDGPSPGHRELTGPYTPPAAGTTPTPIVDANGIVTFETGTEYAAAKNVTVWANWAPVGGWLRIPMQKAGDRWRLTLGPLDAGSYYYKFIVDRVDKKDTSNPTDVLPSEPNWSTFFVPGGGIRGQYLGDVPEGEGGTISQLDYQSAAANQQRSAYVWTPPGYDPDREQPYPVFYLQHGGGQTWTDWVKVGRAKQIFDNLYAEGSLLPMVVVMGNGNGVNFQNELLDNLAPAAEGAYNVSSDPAQRALAGLSMGSGQALTTLFTRPGEFAYIGAFSAFGNPGNADVEAINAGTKLLRIYTGDFQDFTYQNTLSLIAALQNAGIEHEFAPVIPGPHSWDVWQKALIDFAPRLFKADTSAGIPIEAVIPEGENGVLALTVADFGDGVALSAPTNAGDRLRLTGELPKVTVTDSRTAQQAGLGGWAVTGHADDFTSAGQSIGADHLGWTPKVLTPRDGLVPGSPVPTAMDDGPGLQTPAELASANAQGRFGSAELGADLRLEVPVDTQPGAYSGRLMVSLFPVD
jgi:enterochelin esterase-like enzyme